MFVCGEIRMALDDKGRVRIPMKFRLALAEEDSRADIVISGGTEGCLIVETQKSFEERVNEYKKYSTISDHPKQNAYRFLFSTVQNPDEDSQGRFVLQPKLKQIANIKKKVVFLGVGNRIELWSEEVYDNKFDPAKIDMNEVYETIEG